MKKMLFLNTGWMKYYQGLEGDNITDGGEFVQEYNRSLDADRYPPCEIHNFQPYEGQMYGFVRVRGSINISRLGASSGDDSIGGILVVWVARSPFNGTVIVGWFDDATVYRDCQLPPEDSGRVREGRREWGYRVRAKAKNCKLLPPERRDFKIPRGGKGSMGQSNVWYAGQPKDDRELVEFRQKVWDYVLRNA